MEFGIRSIVLYVCSCHTLSDSLCTMLTEKGNEKTVDRRVYLDSPLSVQVITPKLHDQDLVQAMRVVDDAVSKPGVSQAKL